MGNPLAGADGAFPPELCAGLARLGTEAAARLARLDGAFRRRLRDRRYDALQVRALVAIAPGAALRFFAAGRPAADLIEQVEYHGRRLAKLNLPPQEVLEALAEYPAPGGETGGGLLGGLRTATALVLNAAFYQVREAETQAFYGLFLAELEAEDLDELLQRSIEILTRAVRAQAGRLLLAENAGALARRLGTPRYIEAGSRAEALIAYPGLRGRHASYWSIPFRDGEHLVAVAQFGFATPYRWLPREVSLLEAASERCLAAVRRARLVGDLAAREEQVRQLAGHLIRVEEQERRRISRELHDEVGQSLLLLRLELEKLEKEAYGGPLRERLERARELAEHAIAEVRRAIAALSPSVLERLGLAASLRQLVSRFAKSHPARVQVRIPDGLPAYSEQVQTVLYRLSQECLQNVARHSGATQVKLSLASSDNWLELRVADNGAGFDVKAALRKPESFGLAGMRERVAQLGGAFDLRSRRGHGSEVIARLPWQAATPEKVVENVQNTSTPDRRSHLVPAKLA